VPRPWRWPVPGCGSCESRTAAPSAAAPQQQRPPGPARSAAAGAAEHNKQCVGWYKSVCYECSSHGHQVLLAQLQGTPQKTASAEQQSKTRSVVVGARVYAMKAAKTQTTESEGHSVKATELQTTGHAQETPKLLLHCQHQALTGPKAIAASPLAPRS
jgi:hypothetical protein